ncbi:MaoC family dehydratase [Sphaerisporangium sp. TRM90804]|uniref:MaoC family dehydratase n=1 Tax=Sphaerisporangium sp. TRM90804 TaxID=3031113 RepID=UPI002447AA19|nr:MaoC family dehydratase [Sphaerisporangium sp. TRM90804]MDH2427697.1 MaoC family dehydratase [Sphaerisporangium sp. TRM90804]
MRTPTEQETRAGAALPELRIELTPTTVVSTALATMDFTPVHHDVEKATAQGSKDIFLNILTTMGLVERYVTDWAGPDALVRGINVRLGVPAYAGDALILGGRVAGREGDEVTVEVRGTVSLGDHVTGTVRLLLPR